MWTGPRRRRGRDPHIVRPRSRLGARRCIDRWVTRLDRFQNITGVWQGLLVANAGHPDFLRAIRQLVDTVRRRIYPSEEGNLQMLYITGPGLFSRATQADPAWKDRIHLPCHWGNHGNQLRTVWGSGSNLMLQDPKLHESQRGGVEHSYGELYAAASKSPSRLILAGSRAGRGPAAGCRADISRAGRRDLCPLRLLLAALDRGRRPRAYAGEERTSQVQAPRDLRGRRADSETRAAPRDGLEDGPQDRRRPREGAAERREDEEAEARRHGAAEVTVLCDGRRWGRWTSQTHRSLQTAERIFRRSESQRRRGHDV